MKMDRQVDRATHDICWPPSDEITQCIAKTITACAAIMTGTGTRMESLQEISFTRIFFHACKFRMNVSQMALEDINLQGGVRKHLAKYYKSMYWFPFGQALVKEWKQFKEKEREKRGVQMTSTISFPVMCLEHMLMKITSSHFNRQLEGEEPVSSILKEGEKSLANMVGDKKVDDIKEIKYPVTDESDSDESDDDSSDPDVPAISVQLLKSNFQHLTIWLKCGKCGKEAKLPTTKGDTLYKIILRGITWHWTDHCLGQTTRVGSSSLQVNSCSLRHCQKLQGAYYESLKQYTSQDHQLIEGCNEQSQVQEAVTFCYNWLSVAANWFPYLFLRRQKLLRKKCEYFYRIYCQFIHVSTSGWEASPRTTNEHRAQDLLCDILFNSPKERSNKRRKLQSGKYAGFVYGQRNKTKVLTEEEKQKRKETKEAKQSEERRLSRTEYYDYVFINNWVGGEFVDPKTRKNKELHQLSEKLKASYAKYGEAMPSHYVGYSGNKKVPDKCLQTEFWNPANWDDDCPCPLPITVKETMDDNPNRKVNFTKTQIRSLQRYAALHGFETQIHVMERLTKQEKQDNTSSDDQPHYPPNFRGFDMKNRAYLLSHYWVEANFKKNKLDVYKGIMSLKGEGDRYHLPVGNAQADVNMCVTPSSPYEIKYKQGSEDTCVLSSLASCVHALGDCNTAKDIAGLIQISTTSTNMMQLAHDFIRGKLRQKNQKRHKYEVVRHYQVGKGQQPIPLLTDINDDITLCALSNNHCVAIWRKWIFDSTVSHALPLNEKWLLWCNQSTKPETVGIEETLGGWCVLNAYVFRPPTQVVAKFPSW